VNRLVIIDAPELHLVERHPQAGVQPAREVIRSVGFTDDSMRVVGQPKRAFDPATTRIELHHRVATVWGFFTGGEWNTQLGAVAHFGIWPLVVGTLNVACIAMLVAGPLGLMTAIWLSEYAPSRLRDFIKPVLEILAGIPTVVLGFFALTVISPALRFEFIQSPVRDSQGNVLLTEVRDDNDQVVIGNDGKPIMRPLTEALNPLGIGTSNVLAAGIAVGILTLPIIASLSQDALRAVPRAMREGSYGLGATRFETSTRVVVPAALSGIIAAFLLAIARCVGETMVVALAAGGRPVNLRESPLNAVKVGEGMLPMTGYLANVVGGDISNFGIDYHAMYAVAAVLFVMTFALTLVGHLVRLRFAQAYE
jgi:phosphate transport system permease protein